MIINTKTTVSFIIPEEFQKAMEFEKSNPDWNRTDCTRTIAFTRTQIFSVDTGGDSE